MNTNYIKMLCDISELNSLFEENSIEQFLNKTVDMVADHMNTEVCSIYLYNESEKKLTLKATRGLNPLAINNVSMKLGEGLVGTALKEIRIICEETGKNNPHFKYYPDTGEEDFDAFLAVPIIRGLFRIGVLVIQRGGKKLFNDNDIMALRAIASQLATVLEHVKLLMSSDTSADTEKNHIDLDKFQFLKGKTASRGSVLAPVMLKDQGKESGLLTREMFTQKYTLKDFEEALKKTESHLETLQEKVEEKLSDAASLIFASHLLMLKDSGFTGSMREMIEAGENPPSAVVAIFMKYKNLFSESPNPLIREKIQDIEDLTRELLSNMIDRDIEKNTYSGHIIIARELFPSELLTLSVEGISGLILVSGGVTSHVGILARSLRIPLVIISEPNFLEIPENTMALVDADTGNVYINPTPEVINNFKMKENAAEALSLSKVEITGPVATADGHQVSVMLNINLISDLKQIDITDIDGVGLYRTEFPFMIRGSFPSEEEQYVIYRKLVMGMDGKPVTFRTLDIGGDKVLSYYDIPKEENPFLGMRSIRFSLEHVEIFKQQVRAILRAGHGAELRIMFPMISSVDEFISAKSIVHDCIEELTHENYEYNNAPVIGMMVEIPSVIPIIEDLAAEADFFSVGTNDLIQYTLAVDRTNEKVSSFYIPHHPSILRSIKLIADAASKAGIKISVCGDMANMGKYVPFLIGIGISDLSVDAMYIPRVKKTIQKIKTSEAILFADKLLASHRIGEIETILDSYNNEPEGQ